MECWTIKTGVMEYWNTGMLEYWVNLFGISLFTLFHYSNLPPFHVLSFSTIPPFHDSEIRITHGLPLDSSDRSL
jgi:hypothetical protein